MSGLNLPPPRRRKLGYFGYIFGGIVAIFPAFAVYYEAKALHRVDPLTGAIIVYILLAIGLTASFYWIKVKFIRKDQLRELKEHFINMKKTGDAVNNDDGEDEH